MTQRKRFSRFILLLALLLALCAGMFSPRVEGVEAKPNQIQATNVVISEFRTRGDTAGNPATDEFIEIYNPTSSTIILDGLKLRKSSGCGTTLDTLHIFPSGTSLLPGQYYLIASQDYSGSISPDAIVVNASNAPTNMSIADNGGIAITDSADNPIDQVGMCVSTQYKEGTFLTALTTNIDRGYERKLGGTSDSCLDDGINSTDFQLINTSNPQNLSTLTRLCGGNANLRLTQIVDNPTPIKGNNIKLTIEVFNDGPDNARNVQVRSLLPAGLDYVTDIPSKGSYVPVTGIWTVGDIANGTSATLEITVTVANGDIKTNFAEVWYSYELDPNSIPRNSSTTEDDDESVQITPLKVSGMTITNDVNNLNPIVGSNVLFTITVSNPIGNPYDTTNVRVEAPLPVGLTYISSSPPLGTTYDSLSGVWAIGNFPKGSLSTLTLTAKVVDSNPATFAATVISDHYLDSNANRPLNNPLSGEADLSLEHQNIVTTGLAGRVKLKIRLANNGPHTATGIQVRDVLPPGLDYVSHDTTTGTYATNTGIWAVSSLASGGDAVLTITVDVASSGASTANFAEVWASNQFDPDSVSANGSNSEDDNTRLEVPIADLSLTQVLDVSANTAIFTITLTNSGPDDATGIEVSTDLLPTILPNYTYISSGATAGSYNKNKGIWKVHTLTDGASASLVITTSVTGSLQTNWVEITKVDQVDPDSVPGNDSQKEDDDAAVPATDLRLEMSVNDTTPAINSRVEFTLKVTNDGPFNASGVKIRDILPNGLTYISTNPAGDYDPVSGLWTIGSMANGASATLQINARMTSYGTFVNHAEVWKSNLLDPDSIPGDGSTNEDDDASSTVSLAPLATRTPTASPARSVIINEIAWAGTSSSFPDDEWIELYNPTSSAITLTGWKLKASDSSPFITLSGKIPAGGYYLLERDNDSTVSDIAANLIYTGSLSNFGEILILTDSIGRTVDTANGNGSTWPKGSSSTYGTMERVGTSFETDSSWITNTGVKRNGKTASGGNILGTPKNANSATSFTVTPARTITPTRTPTRTPTFAPPVIDPRPIINEILARPGFDWNQDGETDVFDEFIEIKNLTVIDISLTGWKLDVIVPAGTAAKSFSLPNATLKPGERIVFYSKQTNLLLSDGGETVRLVNSSGKIYDAFTYTIARSEDKSFCRLPDGTPGNSWFEDCIPTPLLTNTREGKAPVSPDDSASPFCNLPDTIPLDFFIPECNGYGGDIWNPFYWDFTNWIDKLFIQQTDEKWHTFIE